MPLFEKGNHFSTGRRPGARNKAKLWQEAVGDTATQKVIHTVQKKAEGGDMYAAALVLSRTWPRRKGRPVQIELPAVTDTAGLVAAQAAVIASMAKGEISPDEAQSIAALLEIQRRTIETNDHARQIEELRLELRKVGNS